MNFGERIKKIRLEQGLSQSELGKRMDITQQAVAKYERLTEQPKLETVRRLAEALNVPMGDLVANWSDYNTSEIITDLEENDRAVHLNRQARLIARYYEELNALGQSKAIEQVEMLTKIPEYQKEKEDH